jgi:YbbR domain-containing protein
MSDRRAMLPRRLRQALGNIRRFFDTGNLLRFLVSMVLAFGLWAWVTYENDPETTRVLGGIPVSIDNLPTDFEIVGDPPTVDITVQGPQSIVTPMERDAVVARADMTEVENTGSHDVDVNVDVPSDVRVREVVPESVSVEIDQMATRDDVPLIINEPDDVPPNYQVAAIDVESDVIGVQGPLRTLNQIEHAELDVQISGRTSSFSDSLTPRILDNNGQELTGIQIDPAEIVVSVSLDMSGQMRRIIPVVVGDDELAPGHELVQTTVLPRDEVVVDGSDDALANVFFLTTVPVDISGWDESQIVRNVEIDRSRLPDDISLDFDTVHLSIEIRRQGHEREISGLPISIMNEQPGTTITLSEETASIVLEGTRTAVDAVDADDVTVFVNVANAEVGEYEFEVRVIVPAQVQYSEISPTLVEAVVEENDTGEDDDDET